MGFQPDTIGCTLKSGWLTETYLDGFSRSFYLNVFLMLKLFSDSFFQISVIPQNVVDIIFSVLAEARKLWLHMLQELDFWAFNL